MKRSSRPRRLVSLVALASIVVASAPARAQSSKEDVAKADALFREAQSLVQKGRLAEGCPKFAESQRLDPANGTLLNLALCHEKEGKVGTAYKELQELLAIVSGSKNSDDRERSRIATERLRGLEKKLPRVAFDVSALPKDASITLDGKTVSDPSHPVIVDAGSHTVEATSPRKKPGKKDFDVKEPGTQTIKLDALDDAPQPEPQVHTPLPSPRTGTDEPSFWTSRRVLAASIAGVGLVGIGVGAFFGLDTFSKRDERDPHCQGTICDAEGLRLHDEARTSATISSIAFGVGAAGLAAGTILFVAARPTAPAPSASRSGSPLDAALRDRTRQPRGRAEPALQTIAIGLAGIVLRGTF